MRERVHVNRTMKDLVADLRFNMNMKKIFKRTSLLLATALIGVTVQAQKSPQDMDRFIDALMRRMTVEEKIGQLNLPVTGEITTGQAKSSRMNNEARLRPISLDISSRWS